MAKTVLVFFITFGALLSCANESEKFESAAKEICSCMKNADVDAEDVSSANVNIGVCLLDAEVDLKSPEMKGEIVKQCPEFEESFADFVKTLE